MSNFIRTITTIAFFLFAPSGLAGYTKNVLVIHSYNIEFEWTKLVKQGIDEAFQDNQQVRLLHEYLDAKRFPSTNNSERFWAYIAQKFSETRIDAIMVSDDAALNLLLKNRAQTFQGVPAVFLGINSTPQNLGKARNISGVFEHRNILQTIVSIKSITGHDEVVIIYDDEITGKANVLKAREAINAPEAPSKLHFLKNMELHSSVERLKTYGPDVPILLLGQLFDFRNGRALVGWDVATSFLSRHLNNPIFGIGVAAMNHGAVGVDVVDGLRHGKQGASIVKQVLSGYEIDRISPVKMADSKWIIDQKVLMEHELLLDNLPDNTELINEDKSFYSEYTLLVWIVSSAFVFAFLLIGLLSVLMQKGNLKRNILLENEERYKDVAEIASIIIWECDTVGRFTYLSNNVYKIAKLHSQTVIGQTLEEFANSDKRVSVDLEHLTCLMRKREPISNVVLKIRLTNEDLQIFLVNAMPVSHNGSFWGYRGTLNEVTEKHHLSQKLAFIATYDPITGLINRTAFCETLDNVSTSKVGASSYLCFLDLDRFKAINDTAGHLVGDAMLASIAQVIKMSISKHDCLGRLGGDEFGLILQSRSIEEARKTCEAIVRNVDEHQFQWNDRLFSVGVSIGMVFVDKGFDQTELLSKADIACYKAKDAGRGRLYVAKRNFEDLCVDEAELGYISNVSQALQQKRFYLVKQLIRPLHPDCGKPNHYEILLRYKDENGKPVSPAVFIPAAEKHGVITLIDRWVVETVFSEYERYFPEGNTLVSINLSGISVSNDAFVSGILDLFGRYNVDPKTICFEITETAAIGQMSSALHFIKRMKSLGVRFALDDFGSGTSSFGYLKQLPVDYLKIDGSLIRNIVTEPTDQAIVASIHSIAQMMGMQTIAEFVENDQIEQILAIIGVDFVQGYGVGYPINCDEPAVTTIGAKVCG